MGQFEKARGKMHRGKMKEIDWEAKPKGKK